MRKRISLKKMGLICSAIGLGLFLFIIILDRAYPDILFKTFAPLALVSVLLALAFYFLDWAGEVYAAIKSKDFFLAAFLVGIGALWLWWTWR